MNTCGIEQNRSIQQEAEKKVGYSNLNGKKRSKAVESAETIFKVIYKIAWLLFFSENFGYSPFFSLWEKNGEEYQFLIFKKSF